LPATAAIEYVATCCRTRTRTGTKTRTKTKTGTKTKTRTKTKTVRGAYARSPQVQCVYAPSRLSVPSIVAWRTDKQKNKTKTRTRTKTGTKTKIGTITKIVPGCLCCSPQVQCLYAPYRLSVPSIVAWRTNKKYTQTRPPSSAGSRPPLPKFLGYVEVDAHYIFHPSTIWVRPLCTELGLKNPSRMPILPWSKRIYVALAAT